MTAAVVILSILLISAVAAAILYRKKGKDLRMDLTSAVLTRTEVSNFISRFATGINCEDGIDGAMYSAARYAREHLEAGSVAIYGLVNHQLCVIGVSGDYPLNYLPPGTPVSDNRQRLELLGKETIPVGHGFIGEVAAKRQPMLVPLAAVDPRFADYPRCGQFGSVMAVPMLREGAVVGVICAVGNRMFSGKPFSDAQFTRFRSLASQITMVHQLVQVYGEISRRERIDQELDFVRHFQTSLLPPASVTLDGFSVCARTTSAKEVNGDFYDMFKIDDDRMLVMVGDACGKGMPACMLAAMSRSFARSLASRFTTLPDFLRAVNTNLNRDSDADRFVTLGCCLLDRRGGLVEYGRAGHTDLIMHVHGHLRRLHPRGTALGMLPDEFAEFETICLALDHGTSLMLFSDGLNEALNHERVEFGTDRLTNAFSVACNHRDTPSGIIDEVMGAVHEFEYEQNDDQTMVLIRFN